MRLSSADWRGLRKALLAVATLAMTLGAAPASAQDAAAVVVASSSPRHAVGQVIEHGEMISLEAGASVTVMEESGRVSTLVSSGRFRPAAAPAARAGPSMISSVAALVQADRTTRTPGGVRTLEEERACTAAQAHADVSGLQSALAAQCDGEALAIIDHLVEAAGPPQLFVSLVHSRQSARRVIGVQAQANFASYLYCRLRRGDASLLAVTPDPGALPMQIVASTTYDIAFPSLEGESEGAVQCMAISAADLEGAPDIGDWPNELDAERLSANARVASVVLPIE